jgi:ribonuclease HI
MFYYLYNRNVSKAVQSDSTQSNNSGELQAVKEALRVAKQCGIFVLFCAFITQIIFFFYPQG